MNTLATRHYRLLKSALPGEQRRALMAYVPALFFILAAVMIGSMLLGIWRGNTSQNTLFVAIFTGVYLTYIAFAIPRKLKKRMAKCWDTYDLEIGADYFLRRQGDTPDLQLKFEEVKQVEHYPGRYLRVIGETRQRVIGIPQGIENFDEVLRFVSQVHPVTLRSGEFGRHRLYYMAGGAAAFATLLWSKSWYVTIPLAIGLSCMVLWAVWTVWRSPNASRQTRRAILAYCFVLIPCGLKILEGVNYLLKR
jgi:hypothetical protein